jgi:DNA (cytosine-5)-methyltransferase 1
MAVSSGYSKMRGQGTLIHTIYPDLREYKDISPTISTPSGGGHLPLVSYADGRKGRSSLHANRIPEVGNEYNSIRRLTPIECERLQGFPDNYTKYGLTKDGKKVLISDTQRYKTLGNAVTTNVITEIAKQLRSEL